MVLRTRPNWPIAMEVQVDGDTNRDATDNSDITSDLAERKYNAEICTPSIADSNQSPITLDLYTLEPSKKHPVPYSVIIKAAKQLR